MQIGLARCGGEKGQLVRLAVLAAAVAGAVCLVASLPRMAQDAGYHLFADGRSLSGIPNWSNVASNAGFCVAGAAGLMRARRLRAAVEADIWRVFFAAVFFVGLGSGYYHWRPDNDTLLWDRLPMTLAFAALAAGLAGERFGARAGRLLFGPLAAAGAASVLYWWLTEQAGAGDLRPYILVQYLPMVLVPLIIVLFPRTANYDRPYWILLLWYVAAKGLEWQDGGIFALTGGLVGGHALKHLAAAAGLLFFRPEALQAEGEEAVNNS